MTENEKAKFHTPFTYNDQRNFVKHNPVKKISDDLVNPTKSDITSVSDYIFSERREEITEDVPASAEDVPAPVPTLETVEEPPYTPGSPTPAPAHTLETVKEQPYTPGSRKSTRKNFGKPASAYSDFYM